MPSDFVILLTILCITGCKAILHSRASAEDAETRFLRQMAENTTRVLDSLKENYDKRLRPGFGGKPVIVYVDLYIEDIGEISVTDMDYRLLIYYRQTWNDQRLKFDMPQALIVQGDMLSDIWIPDTFFTNEKSSAVHKVTKDNYLVKIWPNGTVYLSMRISLTGICPMDLRKYPMDSQTCYLHIMSYSGSAQNVLLKWKFGDSDSVTKSPSINLPQMDLIGVNGKEFMDSYSSGNYSRLSLAFQFKRRISLFLTETYVPLVLIVALSWVSFWINYKVAPARVALCITTVLTMITLSAAVRSSLPKVTYTKYSDWILMTGLVYVFGALVEYAVVNYCDNLETRKKAMREKIDLEMAKDEEKFKDEDTENLGNAVRGDDKMPMSQCVKNIFHIELKVESIDVKCRWLVPLSFIILNLIFWIFFIVDSD